MFPNLSERHCVISCDSLCSHATVIQSKLVGIHMRVCRGEGEGRGGRTESRRPRLAGEKQLTSVRPGVQNMFCIESTVIKQH